MAKKASTSAPATRSSAKRRIRKIFGDIHEVIDLIVDDGELFAERIESTASSLLGLVGIAADPISSREHILLSRVFDHAWRAGENLDLAKIIGYVQSPPFDKIGVVSLEEFLPEKKRTEFAMLINNLLASPGFQSWLTGEALDIKRMLHAPDGKPRVG